MSAQALTRLLVLAAVSGCAPPLEEPAALSDTEAVVGRALMSGRQMLLTSAPALLVIEGDRRIAARTAIARTPRDSKLWGLGETGGALYSVAGFNDLVRVRADGSTGRAAKFTRAIGNLIDTDAGMAAQYAVDDAGTPLLWAVDASGALSSIDGPARQALGLSRGEEGALHLLSCSVPPAPVCWLPGSAQILTLDGTTVKSAAQLQDITEIAPARLLATPQSRAVQDAIRTQHHSFIVLFGSSPGNGTASLAEFAPDGRFIRTLPVTEPLRLLLSVRQGVLLAIAKSGRFMEVPL